MKLKQGVVVSSVLHYRLQCRLHVLESVDPYRLYHPSVGARQKGSSLVCFGHFAFELCSSG